MMRVGFIGLGSQGLPMAQRILGLIKTRDPLSENVHLTRIGVMGGTLCGVAAGSCARLARGTFASHLSTDDRSTDDRSTDA